MEAQSIWRESELVLVANEPLAGEEELLTGFASRNPQVRLITVPREPLYRSWNRAIAASAAPLLGIANVDDLRTPRGLEAQARALEGAADRLFTYGPFTISHTFPATGGSGKRIPAARFDRERFTRGMYLGPFFMWRRSEDVATAWFDEQLRVGGDFDLAVRLALHGDGIPVDDDLGVYYDGGSGLSTSGDVQAIERAVLALRYGIYDAVEGERILDAVRYAISHLHQPDGSWLPVDQVVPDYEGFLAERRRTAPRRLRRKVMRRWRR
jgi:hypothetical protein